jgi:hypothetical protein
MGVDGSLRGEAVISGHGFCPWTRPGVREPDHYTRPVVGPTFLLSELARDRSPSPRA